ncbi:four helix bundle protein [Aequorivita sp. Q41]|uniref:four helix bundle protein n=1 Tax=Aequorivita sp. Q41 TaxID=3153300 RepID=UPI003241DAF1
MVRTKILETYKIIGKFPDFEKFGLVLQINRYAVSIPSNIAEGSSKSTNKHLNNIWKLVWVRLLN